MIYHLCFYVENLSMIRNEEKKCGKIYILSVIQNRRYR